MSYEDLAKTRREAAFGLVGTVKALVFVAKTSGVAIAPDSLDSALAAYDQADANLQAFEKARPIAQRDDEDSFCREHKCFFIECGNLGHGDAYDPKETL